MISVSLVACFISLFLVLGCGVTEIPPPKSAPQSLITTPASYYSTPRARYLGSKYKDNLDRLVNRISRNPKTSKLQLANNISGIGGIGFFTHSAAKTPDERYLEVILGAPETFDTRDNYSAKVARLFSLYGMELLSVLSSDLEISQEKELSGYGLNFSWRNIATESPGARVALQRVVTYMSKDNVREFLKREIDQDKLLKEAVIFAVEEDGPMSLISFRPQEIIQDFRLPIREESLAVSKVGTQPVPQVSSSQSLVTDVNQSSKLGKGIENLQNDQIAVKETLQKKQEAEASAPTADKSIPEVSRALQKPAIEIKKPEAPGAASKSNHASPVPPLTYDIESDQVTARQKPPEAGKQPLDVEAKKTTESIRTEPKVQVKSGAITPAPEVDPFAGEGFALTKNMPVKKSMTLSKPKALEGYVIQVAFADRPTAERWAETLERRGYVVSVTETGSAESLRVRIGNFALRDDAESQLRKLRQEGLTGMIVNLPQAYRPEVSPPRNEGSAREEFVSQ
jgi:cell division protein FtsN